MRPEGILPELFYIHSSQKSEACQIVEARREMTTRLEPFNAHASFLIMATPFWVLAATAFT